MSQLSAPGRPGQSSGHTAINQASSEGNRRPDRFTFIEAMQKVFRVSFARGAGAMVLGTAGALALPPWHWLPLAIVAFSGLLLLIKAAESAWGAFGLGWAFGFGHFLLGLHWISYSFYVDPTKFAIYAAPAVLALSAGLAMFTGFAVMASRAVAATGWPAVAALAGTWTIAEWLRGTLFSGFPWNLIGYVWTVSDATIQPAAAVGIYGLSFLTVLLAGLPVLAVAARPAAERLLLLALGLAGAAALWGVGTLRLLVATDAVEAGIRLRLVQPNIPQALKWAPREREWILARHLDLSTSKSDSPPTIVVWPEAAVPYRLAEDAPLRARIASALGSDTILLAGTIRVVNRTADRADLRNSLVAVDGQGEVMALYDKMRLVPFGEYMPFRALLPIAKLTVGDTDFSPGSGPPVMQIADVPTLRPLICYEAVFPGDSSRGRWLLNVTNDAWFGDSAGPYQHFQMARVRAVEEGMPMIRVANTGISAVIDAYGRVRGSIALNTSGVLDASLPSPVSSPTIFAKVGNVGALIAAIAATILAWLAGRRNPASRNPLRQIG